MAEPAGKASSISCARPPQHGLATAATQGLWHPARAPRALDGVSQALCTQLHPLVIITILLF